MNSLTKRILTAAILIPITILGLLFLPDFYFFLAVALVLTLAAWEWLANLASLKEQVRKTAWYLLALWVGFVIAYFLPAALVLTIGFMWWLLAIGLILWYQHFDGLAKIAAPHGFWLSFLVFIPCLVGFHYLHERSLFHLFAVLLIVWSADTGAYFSGVALGKHKLMSRVSPKKSIEGLIGGTIFALLVAIIWAIITHIPITTSWLALVVVTAIFSVAGDLFESMLKRIANCKDSSNLLPGHGGIFDRIDSLTAAVPVYALGMLIITNY
jgi:phosphatidate cytidylyltransferase